MAAVSCEKEGCTVADTGICLLSLKDYNACPHFRPSPGSEGVGGASVTAVRPKGELPIPGPGARQFPAGLELGTEEAAEIMRARYTYVLGVVGSWDAGKTCFLLSLYLMASRGGLPPGYVFAGSQTLPGFEARARRIRKWKGGPLPAKLADHTRLADPRQPAFLHLALRETAGAKRLLDVILTDLPGEWSNDLVARAATADRFAFLRRADGIVVVIDGPLLDSRMRHSELQRSKHLLDRLVQSVGVETAMPLVLLVSKCDRLQGKRPKAVDDIELHARTMGFSPQVVLSAAFSETPETMQNGVGVFEVLEKVLAQSSAPSTEVPSPGKATQGERSFLRFMYRSK